MQTCLWLEIGGQVGKVQVSTTFCGSSASQAFRQPRGRKDKGRQMEKAGQHRLRRALGNYCAQPPIWTGVKTKADRHRGVLKVTGKSMAEPGVGPSSF